MSTSQANKNEIVVSVRDDILVVDSRLIAERLGIQHESFLRTIDSYQDSSGA